MSHADDRDELGVQARVLRKIVVSLLVGGFAYGITELTNQERIWSLTISVFVGGLVLMVQFLVTFEGRLSRAEDEVHRTTTRTEVMVRDGFAKMNEATELFSLVEASALRTDVVTELVRHSTQINPTAPQLVLRFAQNEIIRMSQFLKDLGAGGPVIYEGEDRDWLLALTRNVEVGIDAISLTTVDAVRDGLWTSDLGRRYLREQQDAVRRGVRVRRVFVIAYSDDAETDEDLLIICREQLKLGIDVRVLDLAEIREALFDFVLFDRAISYEVTVAARVDDSTAPTIVNTRLELRSDSVRSRIERFEHLWTTAREVTPAGVGRSPLSR